MERIAKWIKTTDIKDFIWDKNDNGKWRVKNVPLGEGMVDFDTYLKEFKKLNTEAPVSIHYEYDLGSAQRGSREPTVLPGGQDDASSQGLSVMDRICRRASAVREDRGVKKR